MIEGKRSHRKAFTRVRKEERMNGKMVFLRG